MRQFWWFWMLWTPEYRAFGPVQATAAQAWQDEHEMRSRYFPRQVVRWFWDSRYSTWQHDPRSTVEFHAEATGARRDRYA